MLYQHLKLFIKTTKVAQIMISILFSKKNIIKLMPISHSLYLDNINFTIHYLFFLTNGNNEYNSNYHIKK